MWTAIFSLAPNWIVCARTHEMFQLSHELRNIFELQIHRRETDVSNFIQFFQTTHNHLANFTGWSFTFGRLLHVFFDRVYDTVQLSRWYRSFLTSAQQSCHYLVAVKSFPTPVFL